MGAGRRRRRGPANGGVACGGVRRAGATESAGAGQRGVQSDHASIAKISRPCGYISNNTRSPLVSSYPHLLLHILLHPPYALSEYAVFCITQLPLQRPSRAVIWDEDRAVGVIRKKNPDLHFSCPSCRDHRIPRRLQHHRSICLLTCCIAGTKNGKGQAPR